MQSQYGVPEIQQFMADGGCSPVFSLGTADIQATSQSQKPQHHDHGLHLHHQPPPPPPHQQQQQLHHHQHVHLHHHHLPQMQLQHPIPLPSPQAFPHFHPIPVTQQLFQHAPQFHHLFQQEQQRRIHQQLVHLGLEADSGPENSSSPTRIIPSTPAGGGGIPPFLGGPGFKLAVSDSAGGGDCSSRDRLNDEDGILQGDEGSETHIHPWAVATEEEHGIKEPFWRPLDVDYINRNNKRCKEKQPEEHTNVGVKHCKDGGAGENVDDGNHSASNYKLFSELEAIYKPVGVGDVMIIAGGCGAGGRLNCNQQTGSGSALTGENPPATAVVPRDDWENAEDADQGSYTSAGEEAAQQTTRDKLKPNKSSGGSSAGRRKRRRKRKQQMSSVAAFLEALVKRLMEHQEGLHRRFMEVLDRRDRERMSRDETWRQQEADKARREARARAQEQALASSREAAIITFLEKITGESLNLPTREQFQSQQQLLEEKEEAAAAAAAKSINVGDQPNSYAVDGSDDADVGSCHNAGNVVGDLAVNANPSRWPKAEVQALIRVRSNLEARFQEPGLKGPLWEEVGSTMAALGYHRSAKRCKEKWENINKYFRKTKDSPKKRSQNSKTCPYFHQLDQLYSRTSLNKGAAPASGTGRRDSSELLDAVVVAPNEQAAGCFPFPGMEEIPVAPAQLEMRRGDTRTGAGAGGESDGPEREVDGEDEEEGEGESQDQSRGHGADLHDDDHFSP